MAGLIRHIEPLLFPGFPWIDDADTTSGTQDVDSASWTLTYPTHVVADDLLLAVAGRTVAGTPGWGTWPGGWVSDGWFPTNTVMIIAAKKKATGAESGTFTVTMPVACQGAWRIFRIPKATWYGALGTDFDPFETTSGSVPAQSASSGSPVTNPNPANLNPPTWDVANTLWIVACAVDNGEPITEWPSDMPDHRTQIGNGNANGATLAACTCELRGASLDPDVFTLAVAQSYAALTIAVRPYLAEIPVTAGDDGAVIVGDAIERTVYSPQRIRPDADNLDGGWTTAPLWSKVDEETAQGDVITATANQV